MRGRVLGGDNLHDRFTALLSRAHSVDIATAWATPGEHLRALDAAANRGVKQGSATSSFLNPQE